MYKNDFFEVKTKSGHYLHINYEELRGWATNRPEVLDWRFIIQNVPLSEDFIRKFQERMQWQAVLTSQKLSEDFIEEMSEEIRPFKAILERFQNISYSFARKNKLNIDFILKYNSNLSEKNRKTYGKYIEFKKLSN